MLMKVSGTLLVVGLALYVLSMTVLGDYVDTNGLVIERGFRIFGVSLVFIVLAASVLAAKVLLHLYSRMRAGRTGRLQ
ncbi:hypothetical protein [Pelagibacterium halotolerans]|uniref:hypothetical protein n=1 Tax=Pelagibacterium halotolerans TaxID=531813 RepID=UPI00385051C6